VEGPRLIDDALRGMVGRLDPYSSYLDAEEYADLRVSTAGTYAGIGIEVSTADRALRVVRPFRDSPAAVAGIQSGDMISAIDGMPVGSDLDTAMARMRGPRGSTVKLAVVRTGRRCRWNSPWCARRWTCTAWRWRGSTKAFLRAHHDLQRHHGDGLRRGRRAPAPRSRQQAAWTDPRPAQQPGGVLESAVEVADQLLEDGLIVTRRRAHARGPLQHVGHAGEVLSGVPVVVLVNGATASAAEILAGALQDHHRAVLLGQRTYGKGLVQTVMPLASGRAIKLTTSRYFTPRALHPGQRHRAGPAFDAEDEPFDLDDPQARLTLAQRDNGVRAALELFKGRKPRATPPGLTASTAAPGQGLGNRTAHGVC
jgi:carboxyl-terminal processing protease